MNAFDNYLKNNVHNLELWLKYGWMIHNSVLKSMKSRQQERGWFWANSPELYFTFFQCSIFSIWIWSNFEIWHLVWWICSSWCCIAQSEGFKMIAHCSTQTILCTAEKQIRDTADIYLLAAAMSMKKILQTYIF